MITLNNETIKIKQIYIYILTILIIFCMAIFIYFLYLVNDDIAIRIVGTIVVFLSALIWIRFEYNRGKYVDKSEKEPEIKKFVLITRDGDREKEWSCEGTVSFLIGKGNSQHEVDIELGDTHHSNYISNEHAVLNYSDGCWYIEDLNSFNGVGLKKKGDEFAFRLKPLTAYKIDEGDIIYISKTKLLVR